MKTRYLMLLIAVAIALSSLKSIEAAVVSLNEHDSFPPPIEDGLTEEQLDNLLAPIALYPDPLVAQMLPAATFVAEIDSAARYLRANNNSSTGIDAQSWDVSVKSIAHYPEVVFKMSENLDWTAAIGQSYATEPEKVFDSIQRLRKKAKDLGHLTTTPEQSVEVEDAVVKVVPAQAKYIYVPVYDPQVVYVPQPVYRPSTGAIIAAAAIRFSTRLLIGAWLNNDCNWHSHSIFYHGWHGVGWIRRSSTVIVWRNSFYVNSRFRIVRYNSAVLYRRVNYNNIRHYDKVARNLSYDNVKVPKIPSRDLNRNDINTNDANRNRLPSTRDLNRNDINTNEVNRNRVPSTRDLNRNDINTNDVNRNRVPSTRDLNRNDINTNDLNRNRLPTRDIDRGRVPNKNLNKNLRPNPNVESDRGRIKLPTQRPSPRPSASKPSIFGGSNRGAQTRINSQRGQSSRSKISTVRRPSIGNRSRRRP